MNYTDNSASNPPASNPPFALSIVPRLYPALFSGLSLVVVRLYWLSTFHSCNGRFPIVCHQICSSKDELQALQASLKTTSCPHCKSVGYLIRHGFLRGYDDTHSANKTIRATRVFCSNRNRANGCGKTFSVWIADKIKRLFLSSTRDSVIPSRIESGNAFLMLKATSEQR